jgi:hypothetical protein
LEALPGDALAGYENFHDIVSAQNGAERRRERRC